jgi:hypothetical protein
MHALVAFGGDRVKDYDYVCAVRKLMGHEDMIYLHVMNQPGGRRRYHSVRTADPTLAARRLNHYVFSGKGDCVSTEPQGSAENTHAFD